MYKKEKCNIIINLNNVTVIIFSHIFEITIETNSLDNGLLNLRRIAFYNGNLLGIKIFSNRL